MQVPHFQLEGVVSVNGQAVRSSWGFHDLHGKWTILACFPSSHTPVCQATCLGLAEKQVDLLRHNAQAFGLCTNFIADIQAWVQTQGIAIPVLSDFLNRTTAAGLGGLNLDGTAKRATFLLSPSGEIVWMHTDCETAQHHVDESLKALERFATEGVLENAADAPTGAISGAFEGEVVSEATDEVSAASAAFLERLEQERLGLPLQTKED